MPKHNCSYGKDGRCVHCGNRRGWKKAPPRLVWNNVPVKCVKRKIGLKQQVYTAEGGTSLTRCFVCKEFITLEDAYKDADGSLRHCNCLSEGRRPK